MGDFSFGKDERVRTSRDYSRAYREGTRGYSKHFTWVLCKSPTGVRRLGISAGRKVGGAVERNRIKRLLRECFRLNKDRFPQGSDIVITVRPKLPAMTYAEVLGELDTLFTAKVE